MKVLSRSIIWENPLPQLEAKISGFPYPCELPDGTILASHVMGQAFESVDMASFLSQSSDGGKTWGEPRRVFTKDPGEAPTSDVCKITRLADGRLVMAGYEYFRPDPRLPMGNPETGGLLDDRMIYAVSTDGGASFAPRIEIPCIWGHHVEASAALTVLQDGSWAIPITCFPNWDGSLPGRLCGRLMRSYDEGKTWNDDVVCIEFPGDNVYCFEERLCQLEDGTIVVITWNENRDTGERMHNHFTYSVDNGKTFSAPISTGVMGQASSVCHIGGNRLLALHSVRRDTARPGIYGYIVDFSARKWDVVDEAVLWEPTMPVVPNDKTHELFAYIKFGMPSAIRLSGGDLLMTHWYSDDGQIKTCASRIQI